ncbi:hypothetical protein Arub01_59150 [Actinomadura rubrobrunea]|uniref:Uncharacterized protein n=1 Tax=Actinomadura rubrobrunea TaxID=115335 RepID=A0A9W6Q131_9ACTN|nr:hypothetical protein Arub01_59150 [Actinomadura rubrobrunea]
MISAFPGFDVLDNWSADDWSSQNLSRTHGSVMMVVMRAAWGWMLRSRTPRRVTRDVVNFRDPRDADRGIRGATLSPAAWPPGR